MKSNLFLAVVALAFGAGAASAQATHDQEKLRQQLKSCQDTALSYKARIAACDGPIAAGEAVFNQTALAKALLFRSDARAMLADYDGAIVDADAAYVFDGQDRHIPAAQCWARAAANREIEKAKASCEESLAKNPDDPSVMDSAGMVALRQGRWADAAAHYSKAYSYDKSMIGSLYGIALAAYAQGKTESGDTILASVKSRKPAVIEEYKGYGLTVEGMKAKAPKN